VLGNTRFGVDPDPQRALLAVYHDAEEVITGDLPTPIKYFNPRVKEAVDGLEEVAKQRLLDMLPRTCAGRTSRCCSSTNATPRTGALVKLADKLCAYLKCLEEAKAGNREFERAEAVSGRRSRRSTSRWSTPSWRLRAELPAHARRAQLTTARSPW
jgi:5'-deoxynucleotidase